MDRRASEVSGSVLNIGRTAEGSSLGDVENTNSETWNSEIFIHQSINIHE